MLNKLTVRHLLTALADGKALVMRDPKQPEKVIAQASRVADAYYLTGPLFNELIGVELESLFAVASQNGDDEPRTVVLLNTFISDHGAPPEAQVHTCTGLDDALATLNRLFAAYSLSKVS